MGSTKAAVLPVPVCAIPMTSEPVMIFGMAADWMGVGSVYPASLRAESRRGSRPRAAKGIEIFWNRCELDQRAEAFAHEERYSAAPRGREPGGARTMPQISRIATDFSTARP